MHFRQSHFEKQKISDDFEKSQKKKVRVKKQEFFHTHFAIGGAPDWTVFALCVLFTLVWARIAAVFANKASPKTLNRATGVVLVILGVAIMLFNVLT